MITRDQIIPWILTIVGALIVSGVVSAVALSRSVMTRSEHRDDLEREVNPIKLRMGVMDAQVVASDMRTIEVVSDQQWIKNEIKEFKEDVKDIWEEQKLQGKKLDEIIDKLDSE